MWMMMNTPRLNKQEIDARLCAEVADIRVFSEIDSTNAEARRLALSGVQHAVLLVAEQQSAGRGRLGRSFYSPDGTGIYMTYLWQPNAVAGDVISATTAAAVAVHRALCSIPSIAGNSLSIKWVNDIYLSDKKVCGILAEAITNPQNGRIDSMWIGIGINVAPMIFPDELSHIATSLGDHRIDRNELIARIVDELCQVLCDDDKYAHMSYYRDHSMVIGRAVNTICGEKTVPGIVLDIDREGGLIVERPDGTEEVIRSGEISLRLV